MSAILTEINNDFTFAFNDDYLVKKYRNKLGKLLLEGMFCTKFEYLELGIEEQKKVLYRQITGRKIQLLKLANRAKELIDQYHLAYAISYHMPVEIWAFIHIACPKERKLFSATIKVGGNHA